MATLFHDIIHKEIEVYVHDVIINSRKSSEHLDDLRKCFECLRRYSLKLNPTKYVFGVPARKPLGFIVSRKGIKLDPSKIKAIQESPPPMSNKFDIMYITQKAIKGQALADLLAENPVDGDYEPLTMYFPDEEVLFAGKDIEYPENATNGQKRALRRLANNIFLNGEVLYRRTPDLGLLSCVDAAKATMLLEEIHAGVGRNTCRDVHTQHERVHISQKDFESWILLDDYGKRQHPLCADVLPVPDPQSFHSGSTK
nr:uncharacterized protein LOC117278689 [Nicotiana tomentosiformis]